MLSLIRSHEQSTGSQISRRRIRRNITRVGEGTAKRLAFQQTETVKEKEETYSASENGKAASRRNHHSEKGKATAQRRLDRTRKDVSGEEFFCKGVGCAHSTKNAGSLRGYEETCKKVVR